MKKVLVANRGEIAVRIIRACREQGIATVAVYSDVDINSAHVMLADEAYRIGPAEASQSYLNAEKIFSIATQTKVDAIHPGFGFFAENADFARKCASKGICFIGPAPETIDLLGDKVSARNAMKEAGVPIVPGTDGPVENLEEARDFCRNAGFPVLLKAAAGGGGKGMRLVESLDDLEKAFINTKREALNYFGDDAVFIEKFIRNPHHIEVQLLGDGKGNVVHLFERECSLQRRHQKVVEEAPSPFLISKQSIRDALFKVAVEGAKAVNYKNAGTMEFIMDENGEFYFLEMNTRIQVEHPVTEWITGIDIVREMLLIAQDKPFTLKQENITARGHAMESRLYAEDPFEFLPTPGKLNDIWFPGGPFVRIDTALTNNSKIPMEYDPMIAKLSCWDRDRKHCIAKMKALLEETVSAGTTTNLSFLLRVMDNPKFLAGNYTTNLIADTAALTEKPKIPDGLIEKEDWAKLLALLATKESEKHKFGPPEKATWVRGDQG